MGLPHAIGAFNVKLKHASPEACSLLAQGDSVAFKRCFQTINFRPHAIIWWFSIHPPQIWRMHNSLTTSPTSNRKKPWKMGWGVEANPAAQIGVTSANFSGAKLAAFNFRLVLVATPWAMRRKYGLIFSTPGPSNGTNRFTYMKRSIFM